MQHIFLVEELKPRVETGARVRLHTSRLTGLAWATPMLRTRAAVVDPMSPAASARTRTSSMSLGTPPVAVGAAADAARADGAVADRAAAAAPAPGGGGYHIHTARRVRTPTEEK